MTSLVYQRFRCWASTLGHVLKTILNLYLDYSSLNCFDSIDHFKNSDKDSYIPLYENLCH